ncbi:hypothetical protein IWX49DRAFT_293960 [Phyllosticta citricarpa]
MTTEILNPYFCRLCGQDCKRRNRLAEHFAQMHPGHKPYKCPLCNGCETDNLSSLNRHHWRASGHERNPQQQRKVDEEKESDRNRRREKNESKKQTEEEQVREKETLLESQRQLEAELQSISEAVSGGETGELPSDEEKKRLHDRGIQQQGELDEVEEALEVMLALVNN